MIKSIHNTLKEMVYDEPELINNKIHNILQDYYENLKSTIKLNRLSDLFIDDKTYEELNTLLMEFKLRGVDLNMDYKGFTIPLILSFGLEPIKNIRAFTDNNIIDFEKSLKIFTKPITEIAYNLWGYHSKDINEAYYMGAFERLISCFKLDNRGYDLLKEIEEKSNLLSRMFKKYHNDEVIGVDLNLLRVLVKIYKIANYEVKQFEKLLTICKCGLLNPINTLVPIVEKYIEEFRKSELQSLDYETVLKQNINIMNSNLPTNKKDVSSAGIRYYLLFVEMFCKDKLQVSLIKEIDKNLYEKYKKRPSVYNILINIVIKHIYNVYNFGECKDFKKVLEITHTATKEQNEYYHERIKHLFNSDNEFINGMEHFN